MAVETQDAIFSITPPPSDVDELDKTGLLTCSPPLPGLCYPSPTPSSQEHPTPVSADALYLLPELTMSDPQAHDLHNMTFDPMSSESSSFYPLPPISDQSMAQYNSGPGTTFTMYDQSQWYSYTPYPEPGQLLHYDGSSSTQFPQLDQIQPALAEVIPPTPQDIQRASFDFNTPQSTLHSNHRLSASPAFSHASHPSHRGSISSLSRSCSPSLSSHQPGAKTTTGDQLPLRGSLRSNSTSSNTSLHAYGIPVHDTTNAMSSSLSPHGGSQTQAWRCAYPGCTSRATFTRGCDLRKHYNRHSKHLFCRVDGCPQSEAAAAARAKSTDQPLSGGFSSKKDRARHEAKHNPGIKCEWRGPEGEECGRVFSRMDNMKDHVRRIHNKSQTQEQHPNQRHSHSPVSHRR